MGLPGGGLARGVEPEFEACTDRELGIGPEGGLGGDCQRLQERGAEADPESQSWEQEGSRKGVGTWR